MKAGLRTLGGGQDELLRPHTECADHSPTAEQSATLPEGGEAGLEFGLPLFEEGEVAGDEPGVALAGLDEGEGGFLGSDGEGDFFEGGFEFLAGSLDGGFEHGLGEVAQGSAAAAGDVVGLLEDGSDLGEEVEQLRRDGAAFLAGEALAFEPGAEAFRGAGETGEGLLEGGEFLAAAAGIGVAALAGEAEGFTEFRLGDGESPGEAEEGEGVHGRRRRSEVGLRRRSFRRRSR